MSQLNGPGYNAKNDRLLARALLRLRRNASKLPPYKATHTMARALRRAKKRLAKRQQTLNRLYGT